MKGNRLVLSVVISCGVVGIGIAMLLPHAGQAATATQQSTASGQTISSWGHGEIAVQPDRASLTLGVQTRAKAVRTALSSNNTKINAVIAALTKQGVVKTHIQTADLSVWYDNQQNDYVVTHNVNVKLDRVDTVASSLDAAIGAGANVSFGVSFGLKDSTAVRSTALKAAVADARRRGDSIAQALGAKVKQIVTINEATPGYVTQSGGMGGGGGGGGAPIQPGQYVVSADVNVTYSYG